MTRLSTLLRTAVGAADAESAQLERDGFDEVERGGLLGLTRTYRPSPACRAQTAELGAEARLLEDAERMLAMHATNRANILAAGGDDPGPPPPLEQIADRMREQRAQLAAARGGS